MRTRFSLYTLLFSFLFLFAATPAVSALDPPHDAAGCLSCHQMSSTYPKLLPPLHHTPLPGDLDDTVANGLCWSCHTDTTPPECLDCHPSSSAPFVVTHSSMVAGNTYGNWTVECWVCHNQHIQEQKVYGNSSGYIRRSINLANIKGADGKTFKDKDGITKSGIKSVIFKGQTGTNSFADGVGAIDGICEVCHTTTSYFCNDGNGSDQNHGSRQGTNCLTCHNHRNGFIHGVGGTGSGCIECHGHDYGYEFEPGKFSQGNGTAMSHSTHTEHDPPDDRNGPNRSCDACHDTGNFPLFKSGIDTNGDGRFSLTETDVCNPCHNDATGVATGSLVLKPPPAWNTSSPSCNGCHDIGPSYTNGTPKANSHATHSVFSCGTCHSGTTTDGNSINDISVHTDGLYSLQPGLGANFTYTFSTGGGTCTNISCHGSQSAQWGTTVGCDGCHGYPPIAGDGKDINGVFDGGKGSHTSGFRHVDTALLNPANDTYGDRGTGYNECAKCHFQGEHGNGTVDVRIPSVPAEEDYSFDGMSPAIYKGVPGDILTPKTCYNLRCHFKESPSWSCAGDE